MLKIFSGIATFFGSAYLLNSKHRYVDVDFDIYDKFYQILQRNFNSNNLAYKINEKLMGINMMHTVNKELYIESLCGEIDGVFLPNIIGLQEGHDHTARQLEALFGVGFGFVEAGSFSETSQYSLQEDEQLREGNLLLGKANLKSFKARHFGQNSHKFPIGVSLKVGQDVREMIPSLAELDILTGCEELIETVDYLVINLCDASSLDYMIKVDQLKSLISKLKEKRAYSIGVSSLLQHEANNLATQGDKRIVNQVYAAELFGSESPIFHSEAFVPKIYLKVDEEQHSLPALLEIAKFHKEIGLEGLVVNTNNLTTIQRIAVLTQGKVPLIVAGSTPTGIDVINRVKSGAWAIQLGIDYQEKGPKIVENLLDEVSSELKRLNIRNITELRGVNVN